MKKFAFVSILLFTLSSAISYGQSDDAIRRRLFAEVPEKYGEFEMLARKMKCQGVDRVIDSDTKHVMSEYTFKNIFSDELALAVADVKIQGPEKHKLKDGSLVSFAMRPRVVGKNPHYSFALTCQDFKRDWVLASYARPEKIPEGGTLSRIREDVLATFTMHFLVRTVGLPNLLKDPTFLFKGGEFLPGGKSGMVRINFSYGGRGSSSEPSEGFMVLDTEHYWCICEYELAIGSGARKWHRKATNKYDIDKDGVPLWTRHVAMDTSPNLNVETVTENKIERHSGIPEGEFTLTAFGLPEPMGMPRVDLARPRWYVWLSLAAAGVLAGGGIVAMLKQRRSRGPVQPEARTQTKEGG